MDYLVTFLEGVITFISPCLLPMLPLYLAYFAADGADAAASQGGERSALGRTVVNALGFIAGFTLVFVALGALAGAAGQALREHQAVVNAVCGCVVIVFGLHFARVLRIPVLDRTLKPQAAVTPSGFLSSLLFGIVFSIGWTPCVGAFLGSALLLAATQESALHGTGLLVAYSLGLGLPFLVCALVLEQLTAVFDALKSHYLLVERICGGLLVVLGLAMATGTFNTVLGALSA